MTADGMESCDGIWEVGDGTVAAAYMCRDNRTLENHGVGGVTTQTETGRFSRVGRTKPTTIPRLRGETMRGLAWLAE